MKRLLFSVALLITLSAYAQEKSNSDAQFRELYPDTFAYGGKRAIEFGPDDRLPLGELRHCLALALTHHLRAK